MEQEQPEVVVAESSRARARGYVARIEAVWPKVLEGVRAGATPIVAANAAGIPTRTFTHWRMKLEQGDAALVPFFEELEAELAKVEIELIETIRNPPKDDYGRGDAVAARGAQFVLERSRRERWGPKLDITVESQRAAAKALLDAVRERISPGAFRELVEAMATLDDPERSNPVITIPATTGDYP